MTQFTPTTCQACSDKHGEIYAINQTPPILPPLHPNCRCTIKTMDAVLAGNGTKDGQNGADWWIKNCGVLPNYYISKTDIGKLGWKTGKSPDKFAPSKMITGEIYRNDDGHLPQISGRIWREADINYYSGKRNKH